VTILSEKPFLREFISTTKLSNKWINFNPKFLSKVKLQRENDEEYKKELDFLKTEKDENEQNILHQEDGVLFRKHKLWVSRGL
jgi:hypothetical protein